MTKLQAVRKFADHLAGEHVVIYHTKDDDWGMCMGYSKPRLETPRDLMRIDNGDKDFRNDFISRCPLARGFAHVTLSILHELGHHYNREPFMEMDLDEYNRAEGLAHFKLPCEMIATDWAIAWLQSPYNRKVAKAFERDFFGY